MHNPISTLFRDDDVIRIGLIGSSVSLQRESYATHLFELIGRACGRRPVVPTTILLGGVGSFQSSFLVLDQLRSMPDLPKLWFVEYSVNDMLRGGSTPSDLNFPSLYSLHLHRLRDALWQVFWELQSRGCVVRAIHAYADHKREELFWRTPTRLSAAARAYYGDVVPEKNYIRQAWDDVCDRFSIDGIDVGQIFADSLISGRHTASELFVDTVHTTRTGGQLMARIIVRALARGGPLEPRRPDASLRPESRYLFQRVDVDTHFAPGRPMELFKSQLVSHEFLTILPGEELVNQRRQGELAALAVIAGPESGWVALTSDADGTMVKVNLFDAHCFRDRLTVMPIAPALRLPVTLRTTEGPVDVAAAIERGSRPGGLHDPAKHRRGDSMLRERLDGTRGTTLALVGFGIIEPAGSDAPATRAGSPADCEE